MRWWVFGDAEVDDAAAAEREDDEDIKDAESGCDHNEEVTRPSFVQVIADERRPTLAPNAAQPGGPVLCDRPRINAISEFREFGGTAILV